MGDEHTHPTAGTHDAQDVGPIPQVGDGELHKFDRGSEMDESLSLGTAQLSDLFWCGVVCATTTQLNVDMAGLPSHSRKLRCRYPLTWSVELIYNLRTCLQWLSNEIGAQSWFSRLVSATIQTTSGSNYAR
jgi:hypothetical protein